MSVKYITAAEADRLRRAALSFFEGVALQPVDRLRMSGVVGVHSVEYFIVPDGDPRLAEATPDPAAGA